MTFKSVNFLFLFLFVDICFLIYFFEFSAWWLLLTFIVYSAFVAYGSANIQKGFFIKAFCNAKTSEKEIAITFDDGPNPVHTPEILATLAEYNAPATFFVIGKNITGNENIIKQIDAATHLIGNHSFSHSFFIDFKSKKGFMEELNATSEAVYKITGKQTKLFRPPYGVTTPNLAKAAKALHYPIIGWNIRSLDTTADSEEIITNRVTSKIKPGAVILFHDTSAKTNKVLKQTLSFAKNNGFKIVSLDKFLR